MPRDGDIMQPREWFSAGELEALALPGIPATKRGINEMAARERWQRPEWEGTHWRQRQGRGGGLEFHVACLPLQAKAKLIYAEHVASAPAAGPPGVEGLWAWFDRQPEKKKAKARERLIALDAVDALVRAGEGRVAAMQMIARAQQVALSSLYEWARLVQNTPREHWLPALAPRHAGGKDSAEITPEAWSFLLGDYLRLDRPNFSDCYRRLQRAAADHGWTIPAARTLERRIDAIPVQQRVLARDGVEALKRMFPAQRRDRGVFHALEAVNADGHTWDVFVQWPGAAQPARPNMVCFQDLYSGKILSWRICPTLSWHAVRLAFGDVVETYGIPKFCWLDNGREFASKRITGGQANRYRFKVREEEPEGLMTSLGVEVHWTTPYHGQAKPIERAFRDLAQGLAKDPRFAGAYTGNKVTAKPENYGSKAVPLADFIAVVAEGIAEHNARIGRRSPTCAGRSFDQTFAESFVSAPITRATPEQRRLWLLASEAATVRRQDGQIHLFGNRYWSEFLLAHCGGKVVARFDPDQLHQPLHVYSADGRYLGAAECQEMAGFASVEDAAKQARKIKAFHRNTKAANEALGAMSVPQIVAQLPKIEAAEPPQPRLVRPVFGNTAVQPLPVEQNHEDEDELFAAMRAARPPASHHPFRVVEGGAGDE